MGRHAPGEAARTILAAAMTEEELLSAIIQLAKRLGWMATHFRPARTAQGWRTPLEGDRGFVDAVVAHRQFGLLLIETKSATGKLRPEQIAWRDVLSGADEYRYFLFRPADWASGFIERVLKGEI